MYSVRRVIMRKGYQIYNYYGGRAKHLPSSLPLLSPVSMSMLGQLRSISAHVALYNIIHNILVVDSDTYH